MDSTAPASSSSSRPHLFGLLAGLFLAAGLCTAAFIGSSAWVRISESQSIFVNGSARKNIRSDLVIWRASFSVEAPSLLEAQEKLRADRAAVDAWLAQKGVSGIEARPVRINEITAQYNIAGVYETKRTGFRLSQSIEVRSPEVERVPRLATESTELIAQGVSFVSDEFQFIYTKLAETKIELMADAAGDARIRAEQIAAQGRRTLGEMRSARMGVVQVNPLHSTATSWDGNNDVSALDKTITVTVAATFSIQ